MNTERPKLICCQPGPCSAVELQTDETPLRLVGAVFFVGTARANRLTEDAAQEWAELIVRASNCHDELVDACLSLHAALDDLNHGWPERELIEPIQATLVRAETALIAAGINPEEFARETRKETVKP